MATGQIDHVKSAWQSSLQAFGEQLRHRREHTLRLTQTQMGARVGLDQSSISRIEAGHKPRDKAAALILGGAYRLSATETKAWLELLYGNTTIHSDNGTAPALTLDDIYTILERLRGAASGSHAYDYFNPTRHEPTEDALTAVDWLLNDERWLPRAHLLIEFAAVLMHHLNEAGQHRRRLTLALAAADAAAELERHTIEGWLRSDAIPWTLLEHHHDPAAARPHLQRGLALAHVLKNREMEALARALLARVNLYLGDSRHARANLLRARHLSTTPAIQTRIDWIDGDLALRQKRYEAAFALYQSAESIDLALGYGHHTVVTPLFRLGELHLKFLELVSATHAYNTLLGDMCPPLIGHRLARAFFGLARVARQEGDADRARRLADQALAALATADDDPQFRQVIALFVASLSD